jgi:hypothetical protein
MVLVTLLAMIQAQADVTRSPDDSEAHYERSHALVIGVSAYDAGSWSPLRNTVQDAAQVADALTKQGFSVELLTDGTPDAKCIENASAKSVL